ncbi:MAG: hypothetical protein ABIT71_12150 [Vicinamibacteraceae bacterium]
MIWRWALLVACCSIAVAGQEPARTGGHARPDARALAAAVDARLAEHGEGASASVWLGGVSGTDSNNTAGDSSGAWFARDAAAPRATASAIKTFYLIELFDRYADALDRPLPGVDGLLADDTHPAISHFTPEQRVEIRRDLTGASVRHVGLVMMGTAPASNIVYNAAANLTTAALGGPEALTALIHARDPAFSAVAARRYMLRNRKERGDNEAPTLALAAVYQRLAARRLAGVEAATLDAIRAALHRRDDAVLGPSFAKDGSLDTDPMSEVRAGWYDTAKGPLIYVVMTMQPVPGPAGRDASGERLSKTAGDLANTLVQAGWASMK